MSPHVLLIPGWQNSGPDHWQTRWETKYGYTRVEQHDWQTPLRGDWMTQLEEAVLATNADRDIYLVAHSLGCALVVAWSLFSTNSHRVKGVLLVAPPDLDKPDLQERFPGWGPVDMLPLPFPNTLVCSSNDPNCSMAAAWICAAAWHSRVINLDDAGHINEASGLGDWDEGHQLLLDLMKEN